MERFYFSILNATNINSNATPEIVAATAKMNWHDPIHGAPDLDLKFQVKTLSYPDSISVLTKVFDWSDNYTTLYFSVIYSMVVDNCDWDPNKEAIIAFHSPSDSIILSICDCATGSIESQFYYPMFSPAYTQPIGGLAIIDFNQDSLNEILVVHKNGDIETIDGITGDTIATGNMPSAVNFFAFQDIDGLPEIYISDGDSLFVYSVGYVGVEEEKEENLPEKFTLFQNYPNPFSPKTIIEYYLPKDGKVEINIYNILGQKVKTLVDGYQKAGFRKIIWDGKDQNEKEVASGIYFYRLKKETEIQTKKMILVK